MEENLSKISSEDELSFIDIFAVLFRYKWMILGITAAAVLIFGIYTEVCKKLPPEKSPNPVLFQNNVRIQINPNDMVTSSYDTVLYRVIYSVELRNVLCNELKESGINDLWGKLWNNYKINYDGNLKIMNIEYKDTSSESTVIVLNALSNYIINYLNDYAATEKSNALLLYDNEVKNAKETMDTYEKFLKEDPDDETYLSMYIRAFEKYTDTVNQRNYYVSKWETAKEPAVIYQAPWPSVAKEAKDIKKPLLITIIGSLVVGILLAFILNAIDNIRNDSDAVAKFHEPTIFSKKNR